MLESISQTPSIIAWALGFFMGVASKRGRVQAILDRFLPTKK